MIADGSTVRIEFSLTLSDGSLVQTNVGGDPLGYKHGEGQLLPALESALTGRIATDELEVQLSPEEAYGPVRPDLVSDVPIGDIPEDAREVGAMLQTAEFDGPIRVREVREDVVVLDFNHPLAGEELTYSIKILSVESGLVDQ